MVEERYDGVRSRTSRIGLTGHFAQSVVKVFGHDLFGMSHGDVRFFELRF